MSARHLDPIVWAAAYAAAFVHLYAEEHGATDVQPGFMSRRTVALERVHAPAAVEIADAAVLALGVEEPRQQTAFTAQDAARMAADLVNESADLPATGPRRTARLAASLMGLAAAAAKRARHPEVRDAAWARLVKAVEVRWREDIQGAAQCDYRREIAAAKDALRALGVDEDLLRLGEQ